MFSYILLLISVNVLLSVAVPLDNKLKFEPFSEHEVELTQFESFTEEHVEAKWSEFKENHGKTYSDDMESHRKSIFLSNLKRIEMHNILHSKGHKSYTLGVNEYADLEHSEFVKLMNGYQSSESSNFDRATYMEPMIPYTLPSSVDWRDEGYVTPVKNQGHCGSCWAFSTTGALEGQHMRQTGKLVSLSEQNLVDCSAAWGNQGCNGGLMDNAFQYIKENGGIDTEQSYPYTAKEGLCHFRKRYIGAEDVGFVDIPEGSESDLKKATALEGPISVAIDASHMSFQLYNNGVYVEENCSSEQLDHGVLVVGYGTDDDGKDYWIVKNSWGNTWGEGGFVRMARNMNNMCGIASSASYPRV